MDVIVLIIAHHHLLSDFADLPGWGRCIVNEKSAPLRIYRGAILIPDARARDIAAAAPGPSLARMA